MDFELREAARLVVQNWAHVGDLAGAVRQLEAALQEAEAVRPKAPPFMIALAKAHWTEGDMEVEIDENEAVLSQAEDGDWVSAWVWIPKEET